MDRKTRDILSHLISALYCIQETKAQKELVIGIEEIIKSIPLTGNAEADCICGAMEEILGLPPTPAHKIMCPLYDGKLPAGKSLTE